LFSFVRDLGGTVAGLRDMTTFFTGATTSPAGSGDS
jgi:hypothetical protein